MNDLALHQYKLRLTNLSQSNRSLKLGRLSAHKDLDLVEIAQAHKLSPAEILARIVAGKKVDLITQLSAREEVTNLLDRKLNKVYRQVETLMEETGSDDLFLGYPFVEGKFLNGAIARCPILLFPVRLLRDLSGRPRWRLEVPKGESIQFNRTFFLAYEKFQQVRLPKSFWEEEIDHKPDLQELLNELYAFFKEHNFALNFNSDLFQFQVTHFPNKDKASLERLEMGKLKFLPHAVLGIFPQSDSALVRDYDHLEAHAKDFEIDRFLEMKSVEPIEKYIPENQRFFVTPLDQSQEAALLAVKNDQSVVVHGPPGTGKSQVILNLIADALARGQKVLVCSQKRAALDVVYQRLAALGLGPFAALVHDYRGDRAKIFEKIRLQIDTIDTFKEESIDLGLAKWERDFRLDARKIDEYNSFFDGLFTALNDNSRFGLSAHQLYLLSSPTDNCISIPDLGPQFDDIGLRGVLEKAETLFAYREFLKPDYPWVDRLSFRHLDRVKKGVFRDRLAGLGKEVSNLVALRERVELVDDLPLEPSLIYPLLKERKAFFSKVAGVTQSDLAVLMAGDLKREYIQRKLGSLRKVFEAMAGFKVLDNFNLTHFLDLRDHLEVYRDFQSKAGRLFSLSYLKARWYLKAILKQKSLKLTDDSYRLLNREFRVLERLVKHGDSFSGQSFFDDLPLTDSVTNLQRWLLKKTKAFEAWILSRKAKAWPALKPRLDSSTHSLDQPYLDRCETNLNAIQAFADALQAQSLAWKDWLHLQQIERLKAGLTNIAATHSYIETCLSSFDKDAEELKYLDGFLADLSSLEKSLFKAIQPDIVVARDMDSFSKAMNNGFYLSWIQWLELQHPVLAEVSSRMMPSKMSDFQAKVDERQEKVIQLVLRKLKDEVLSKITYNRLGNPVTYRNVSHQVRKKRLIWSVRRLVREYWNEGLSSLMPCWLASPESVSAVFPMEEGFFDLVIFDEASQCYVERAFPVLLRGRNAVIAGDDKQLPPFDLYNVKIEEDEDDLDRGGIALEVESALDLARNTFSEAKLSWHYRSNEEALINFSNHAFYDGRLQVIPNAIQKPDPAIEFIKVDGVWEKSRNEVEAQRVLDLVEVLIQDPAAPSIGIVTFNFRQQELIRDMLDARLEALGSSGNGDLLRLYDKSLSREKGEERQGIFVKNIENVQGDERDVIIFSVAYGRNSSGKLVHNFGLLNHKGGGNRLNVAVTRARKKVVVVCSFDPVELDVGDSLHAGPRLFKQYLRYAQAISEGHEDTSAQILAGLLPDRLGKPSELVRPNSLLADLVAARLQEKGFEIVRDIGDTQFKLDLAVKDPAGGYLLGIECEGQQYFRGRSSKEREVYRHKLLLERGWKIHRVWARNFHTDPNREMKKILELLKG